jgi:hypothetical protein
MDKLEVYLIFVSVTSQDHDFQSHMSLLPRFFFVFIELR